MPLKTQGKEKEREKPSVGAGREGWEESEGRGERMCAGPQQRACMCEGRVCVGPQLRCRAQLGEVRGPIAPSSV